MYISFCYRLLSKGVHEICVSGKVSFTVVDLLVSRYAVIMAFDVKVEREAQEMADSLGVNVFVADIIYHLFDRFTKFREEWLQHKREEFKHLAIFPCKMRIYPEHIFNSRDPIVCGVCVEAGFLREGTMICVPSKEVGNITKYVSLEIIDIVPIQLLAVIRNRSFVFVSFVPLEK